VKFGFEIYHSDYYCYHLWHSRAKKNSWYENLSQQKNFNEYKRICMMTTEELKQEISTWPWIKDDQ
jgi:predicted glycosyltransferase involved in capsule biosynthesis